VEDAVVATSADDQRTYTVDGVSYHHIIDPATGYPARLYRSVTVILPLEHTTYSDGFSTALFIMNCEDGQSLIDTYGGSALWLTAEGEVVEYNRPNSK
jgi:thiamine biosynthesis lipoprotein